MSVFDTLVSEVWAAAREDGGVLLAEFTPPSTDAARAARALRLPELERVRESLRQQVQQVQQVFSSGADRCDRANRALARGRQAAAGGRDMEAVLALSEALRYSPCRLQQLEAREDRAQSLLRLKEADACLQDLSATKQLVGELLMASAPVSKTASKTASTTAALEASPTASPTPLTTASRVDPATEYAALFHRYSRTLLATSACLELRGDVAEAEAVLREAMAFVRDSAVEASVKTEAITVIVQQLRRTSRGTTTAPTAGNESAKALLVSSGLGALPKLLGGPHPSLPSASAALDLRTDGARGRHLVAKQDIPAGSALIVERPYAWSLSWDAMTTHCLHCCAPVLASEPCPHCSNVVFCGPGCRQAALEAYHLVECPVLRQLVAPGLGSERSELSAMSLLVFRIVVRAAGLGAAQTGGAEGRVTLDESFVEVHAQGGEEKKKKKKKGRDVSSYGPVFGQLTHSESRTPADLLKRSLTAAFLTRCLEASLEAGVGSPEGGPSPRLTEEQTLVLATAFLRHLQSCSCNAYGIAEQRLEGGAVRGAQPVELGGACYPTVSLVNHACAPNAVRHSHGNVCVVRALHAIPKGGEVLDNYGPNFLEQDVDRRGDSLAKQYMFKCGCDACRLDWPVLEDLPQLPEHSKHSTSGKKRPQPSRTPELAARLQSSLQGLLKGQTGEALQAALRYSAALHQPLQPPCREQVRADQVASLCWSLAGNVVRY